MKMFFRNCRMALQSLNGYKHQSALSMLGLMFGAICLLFMLSLSLGAKKEAAKQLESLGENVIIVIPGQVAGRGQAGGDDKSLKADDVKIIAGIEGVKEASVGIKSSFSVGYRGVVAQSEVSGVSPEFLSIRKWELADGRFLDNIDLRSFDNVCVIGETIRREVFVWHNPIGNFLSIGGKSFRVVGILEPKGFSISGRDQDNVVYVPFTTIQKRLLGQNHIGFALVSVVDKEAIPLVHKRIKMRLREAHNLKDYEQDDFTLMNQSEFGKMSDSVNRIMSILLGAGSFTTLVSGGIGIMNILLASVRERTREIGLRMALGACKRDVSIQFFIEGVIISLGGAGIGSLSGLIIIAVIGKMIHWPMYVSPFFVVFAWLISASVGIFFGYWPARKASRLNPIDALKYE